MKKFNFFIVGASWCNSSREYRILLETYAKKFPNPDYTFHSIVIDDPQEKIFNSRLIQEMFPNKENYSHNSIPKFLAIQEVDGKTIVWEEGAALKQFFKRFFVDHQGFLNHKTQLFKNFRPYPGQNLRVDPYLTSVTK